MIKLINISEIQNSGIQLDFELEQWARIWKFGTTFQITVSDSVKKNDDIRSIANQFVKGKNAKQLLKENEGKLFPLSLLASMA